MAFLLKHEGLAPIGDGLLVGRSAFGAFAEAKTYLTNLSQEPESYLTEPELSRLTGMKRPMAREDFVAAHILVRYCVGQLLLVDPQKVEIEQHCASCRRPHGRPSATRHPEVFLSMAHSRGLVAAIAAGSPVGVDIERMPLPLVSGIPDPLLRDTATQAEKVTLRSCDMPERVYSRLWVMKESLVKIGALSMRDLNSTDVTAGLLDDALVSPVLSGRLATHLTVGAREHHTPGLDLPRAMVGVAWG